MTDRQNQVIQGRFLGRQPRMPVVQSRTAASSPQLNAVQLHQQTVAAHQSAHPKRHSRNLPPGKTLARQPARTSQAAPLPSIPGRPDMPPRSASQPAQPQAIQRSANNQAFQLPPNQSNFGSGAGQPLPDAVRQKMESYFQTSFADVRVHVGAQASSIGALAFTHGSNVYFAPGQYNPHTVQGQQLLGHELTHVVQQRAGRVRNPFGSGVAVVQDPGMEAEADRNGMRVASYQLSVQPKLAGNPPGAIAPHLLELELEDPELVQCLMAHPNSMRQLLPARPASQTVDRVIQRAEDDEDYVPPGGRRQTLMGSTPSLDSVVGRELLKRWAQKNKARYLGRLGANRKYRDLDNWEVKLRKQRNQVREWIKLKKKYKSGGSGRRIAAVHMGHKLAAARYYSSGAKGIIKKKHKYRARYGRFKKPGKNESYEKRREFMTMPENYRFEYYSANSSAGSGGYTY